MAGNRLKFTMLTSMPKVQHLQRPDAYASVRMLQQKFQGQADSFI